MLTSPPIAKAAMDGAPVVWWWSEKQIPPLRYGMEMQTQIPFGNDKRVGDNKGGDAGECVGFVSASSF